VAGTVGMNIHRVSKPASFLAQAKALARDESGATAIEYAMIGAGIAVAIVAAVGSLGSTTLALFERVEAALR
jgi:pilus assembly protein Flp/PilA